MVIGNVEETSEEEMGMLSDGKGDRLDQELPDIYCTHQSLPGHQQARDSLQRKAVAKRDGHGVGEEGPVTTGSVPHAT